MPNIDPQAIAALLRQQNTMAGQGAITEQERAYLNQMNAGMANLTPMNQMAGQGAITEDERTKAMQSMGQMGQGMGGMSEADRKFLMMQQGQ